MNVPETITMLALLAAIFFAFGIGRQIGSAERQRNATPRKPNPEPGPTNAEVMEWGRKFEAAGKRVTPHTLFVDGLREERRAKESELKVIDQAIEEIEAEDIKTGEPYTVADAWKNVRRLRAREVSELDQVLAEDERADRS